MKPKELARIVLSGAFTASLMQRSGFDAAVEQAVEALDAACLLTTLTPEQRKAIAAFQTIGSTEKAAAAERLLRAFDPAVV